MKIQRKDGRVQYYAVKNKEKIEQKYKLDTKRKVWIRKTRQPTIREQALKRFSRKKASVMELKQIREKVRKQPTIKEVSGMIDKKMVCPYGQKFSNVPTKQDSFKMYRTWLKNKGLKDEKLIKAIIGVSDKVMKTRVKAEVVLISNDKGFIGRLTVFGAEPHEIGTLIEAAQKASKETEIVTSPGGVAEAIKRVGNAMKSSKRIKSFKFMLQNDLDNYRIDRWEIKYDFA